MSRSADGWDRFLMQLAVRYGYDCCRCSSVQGWLPRLGSLMPAEATSMFCGAGSHLGGKAGLG